MNSFELFEAIGELPLETVQIKEAASPRRRIVASIAAVFAVVLALQITVWIIEANNRPTPPTCGTPDRLGSAEGVESDSAALLPEGEGTLPGDDTTDENDTDAIDSSNQTDDFDIPADTSDVPLDTSDVSSFDVPSNGGSFYAFAPVTVFGLTPANAGEASLVSEDVSFTKLTTWPGSYSGYYDVEMHYIVKLAGKASFVLPYVYIPTEKENIYTDIYVDGSSSPADCYVQIHPNAGMNNDVVDPRSPQGHTVYIYPDHWEETIQPANTYELLMQMWKKEESTPFTGYTVSNLINESRSGYVQMYTFEIEGAGTHEIVIKLFGKGAGNGSCYFDAIEWAASPSAMWNEIGERNISINLPEGQFQRPITDELFYFKHPKEQ